jgi:hypothetical protein
VKNAAGDVRRCNRVRDRYEDEVAHTHTNAYRNVSTRNLIARTHRNVGKIVGNFKRGKTGVK